MSREAGVTVIVPFHDGLALLERTLRAVVHDCGRLDVPWEVLLVDNDSRDVVVAGLRRLVHRLGAHGQVRILRRRGLRPGPFQPGAARNLGIEAARHPWLVFLDADSIPSRDHVASFVRHVRDDRHSVFLGHRVFVDAGTLDAAALARDRALLDALPPVPSTSNYGNAHDRRLPELRNLATHPRPYNCLFGCNFGLHTDCLGGLRFDPRFDGYWGYEDIELGHRLHQAGRSFRYLAGAFVYHQEGAQLDPGERELGRRRNFGIAAELIPGFLEFRRRSERPGALPAAGRSGDHPPPPRRVPSGGRA